MMCICVCRGLPACVKSAVFFSFVQPPTALGHEVGYTALWRIEHARSKSSVVNIHSSKTSCIYISGGGSGVGVCQCFVCVSLVFQWENCCFYSPTNVCASPF